MGMIRHPWRRAASIGACALLAMGGMALLTAGEASAAVPVHCPTDNLQTAINAAPSGTRLIVSGTCVGNFTFPAGKTLTLDGPAVLDGNHSGTVLLVQPTAVAKLISITVQNGDSAGINNGGTLNATYVTVTRNINTTGAGIVNSSILNMTNSVVTGNTARVGGGGIWNIGGSAVANISSSTIDHNGGGTDGGGILNETLGQFTLLNSFVTKNRALTGGGIDNDVTSTFTVKGSHINNNNAPQGGNQGGGFFNAATAAITSTEVLGNTSSQGGGVYNAATGNLNLKSSAVTSNTATGGAGSGGGVRNLGTISRPGSNVAGNTPDNCVGC
ncbi:MAG: hypothetical protein JO148_10300 [Acidimicrobiia bacterium]|nr:hypothetical protein [Acidimicrobiia bacterium]